MGYEPEQLTPTMLALGKVSQEDCESKDRPENNS